ncbi:MAG: hypothetical protein U1O81_07875 [Planktothrix rubescens PR223]|jgi:hypothetical protein
MKPNLSHRFTTGRAAFLLLLTGSTAITLATMCAPLAWTALPVYIPAFMGGVALVWLRNQFSTRTEFATVFLTLLPLLSLTGFVYWQQGRGVMPLAEMLPIWGGALAGALCALLIHLLTLKKHFTK